jgi:CRP-like cAMP-binding protein
VVLHAAGADADDRGRAAEINLTLDTLKAVPLFRTLSYQQLVRILNVAKQRPIDAGDVVFNEGDSGEELHVILRGKIELQKKGVKVADLIAGAHLGEMALIDDSTRSTTAIATEAGKLLSISRQDFYDILRKEPPLAVKLLWSFVRVLAYRLRTTTAELSDARGAAVPDLTAELFEG